MVNCSDEAPITDVFYDEISGDALVITFLAIASILATICLVLFFEEIAFIRRHYKQNDSRAWKVILLLGLYPVVCINSLIAVLVPTSATLVDLMASCYVSVCIYTFINMTIECFGGEDKMVATLSGDEIKLNTPPCCCCLCCIMKPIKLTRESLRTLELMALQVMFVRPVLLFIAAILWTDGKYKEEIDFSGAYIYIEAFSGISTLVSMYGLIVIFRASRLHLTHYHLAWKFVPLQLVIILVNLQSFVFRTLAGFGIPECKGTLGSRVRASNINNGLLVVEVFLCCLLARRGYRTYTPNQDEVLENVPPSVRSEDPPSELGRQISITSDNAPIYQNSTNNSNAYGAYSNTMT